MVKRMINGLLLMSICTVLGCNNSESTISNENKFLWIENAFETIEKHPEIKAISYWHEEWEQFGLPANLKIDSSPQALEVFRTGIESHTFTSDIFISAQNKIIPPEVGVYHAAYPGFIDNNNESVTSDRIKAYENLAQKNLAWVYFSDDWSVGITFPKEEVKIISEAGSTPFIRLMAWTQYQIEGKDPNYSPQAIIDGTYDDAIEQWALDAKSTNIPMLVEYGTEVNGNWFPWNGQWNGGGKTDGYGDLSLSDGPERFVDAYRHIIDIFRSVGVDNITWAYHVNAISYPEEEWNTMKSYYPGDDYIDWIGISIYGPINSKDPDKYTFEEIFNYVYDEFTTISDNKPLAIFEFGVGEY